jgi:hypothetical protein
MSIQVATGPGVGSEIASNRGWGDFVRFAETLDGAPELLHLVTYGWCNDAATLSLEIEAALGLTNDENLKQVGQNLLEMIDDAGPGSPVIITDGTGPDVTDRVTNLFAVSKLLVTGNHSPGGHSHDQKKHGNRYGHVDGKKTLVYKGGSGGTR